MNYSEAEFDKAYKKIIRRIIKSKSPVNNPMAYILGGQAGAGKTGLQRNLMVENSNIIIINADVIVILIHDSMKYKLNSEL